MKPIVARTIQCACLSVMILMCMLGVTGPNYRVIGIGLGIGTVGTAVWVIFGRCPYCGEHLGRNMPVHCPHCGEKIEK